MKELKKEILEETENDYEIPDLKAGLENMADDISDDYIHWFTTLLTGEKYEKNRENKIHCVTIDRVIKYENKKK